MAIAAELAGAACVLVALLDVFLTALVARYGTSLISERIFAATWWIFRVLGRRLSDHRRHVLLIYAGPVAVTLMLCAWVLLLQFGFALVYMPMLGTQIRAQFGAQPSPGDFITALYISTDCLTTAGNGDFAPITSVARAITSANCALGIITITLSVTYLVQIFTALRERNIMALSLHYSTQETGDAAEWIASLSGGGTFEGASAEFSRVATELAANYEAYHLYASLLYFHFAEAHYSHARVAFVVMDASALVRSILDPDKHANFARHGSTGSLARAGRHVADELAQVYLPAGIREHEHQEDDARTSLWRVRYFAARDRLAAEGVTLIADAEAGFQQYASDRREWDALVRAFGNFLNEPPTEIAVGDQRSLERAKRAAGPDSA